MCDGDECGAERTADGDAGEMGWTGDDRNGRSGWTVYDEGGCSVRGAQGYTGGVHITSPRCWSYVEGEMGREKASSSVGAACEVCTDSVCSKACHRMRLSHLSSASTWLPCAHSGPNAYAIATCKSCPSAVLDAITMCYARPDHANVGFLRHLFETRAQLPCRSQLNRLILSLTHPVHKYRAYPVGVSSGRFASTARLLHIATGTK